VVFQQQLEKDWFSEKPVFSNDATFHVCGKVNNRNLRNGGKEHPHAVVEHIRDLPKVNAFVPGVSYLQSLCAVFLC
jgi:hypothetical protein